MNPSKLYVPNPEKWVNFFDRVAKGKTTLEQSGAGRRRWVIPVDKTPSESKGREVPIQVISPAEMSVQQAESELVRDHINLASVVSQIQSSAGRRRKKVASKMNVKTKRGTGKKSTASSNKGGKRKRGSVTKHSKTGQKPTKPGQKPTKKRQKQSSTTTRQSQTKTSKDIFSF